MPRLSKRLAGALKKSDLSIPEQIACVAAVEMVRHHWNSSLRLDIGHRYGTEVVDVFTKDLKSE